VTGEIRRVNPRRPFTVTEAGLKRIVLGESAGNGADRAGPLHVPPGKQAPRPLRLTDVPEAFILVAAHSDRGALDDHTHQVIAAAALLAGAETAVAATAVVALIFGDLAEDLAPFGADMVATVPACGDGAWLPELELACLNDIIARYRPAHILMPDNAHGDGDLGRRLAAGFDGDFAAHVVELSPAGVAVYWQGGRLMARRGLPRVMLLDPGTTDPSLPFRGAAEHLDDVMPSVQPNAYQDLGLQEIEASQLPLEEADFIVSAGNGITDIPTFKAVAKIFGAAIGASRVAVDAGKFPREAQIGATGKTVSASVYMAIGISGAVQHLQGIRACRHVIAINADASAPITKRADLTLVDDAGEIMRHLLAETDRRNWMEADAGS
jgi:electron transfer flavoprotein alpha subunit